MLRDLVERYDVSVYRVSKDSGVPYTTLNELINGKKDPAECSVRTLARLAAYFELTLDQFYKQLQEKDPAGGFWSAYSKKLLTKTEKCAIII